MYFKDFFLFEVEMVYLQQIPHVADLLYMARLTSQPFFFEDQNTRDSVIYFTNLGILFAEAASELYKAPQCGDPTLHTVLAELIVEMCPPKACCLFVHGYVEAAIKVGKLPNKVLVMPPMERRMACTCKRCISARRLQVAKE